MPLFSPVSVSNANMSSLLARCFVEMKTRSGERKAITSKGAGKPIIHRLKVHY